MDRVDLTTELSGAVTLKVAYRDDARVLVAQDGHVIDRKQLPASSTWAYLLSADANGRWRIASAYVLNEGAGTQ